MGTLLKKCCYVNSHVHESNSEKKWFVYSYFFLIDGGLAILLYQMGLSYVMIALLSRWSYTAACRPPMSFAHLTASQAVEGQCLTLASSCDPVWLTCQWVTATLSFYLQPPHHFKAWCWLHFLVFLAKFSMREAAVLQTGKMELGLTAVATSEAKVTDKQQEITSRRHKLC